MRPTPLGVELASNQDGPPFMYVRVRPGRASQDRCHTSDRRGRGTGIRAGGTAVSTARRHPGEAGQILVSSPDDPLRMPIRLVCDHEVRTERDGRRDALNKCGRPGASSARDDVPSIDISALNTDPRMWAFRVLRAPSEL